MSIDGTCREYKDITSMQNKTQLKMTKEFEGKWIGTTPTSSLPVAFYDTINFNDDLAMNIIQLFNIPCKELFSIDQKLTITISIETDAYKE